MSHVVTLTKNKTQAREAKGKNNKKGKGGEGVYVSNLLVPKKAFHKRGL